MLTLAHLLVLNSSAQDKEEILWLVGEEVVKPEMIDQYMEVSKELMELCKAEEIPLYLQRMAGPNPSIRFMVSH
jgi:hypothetical protein